MSTVVLRLQRLGFLFQLRRTAGLGLENAGAPHEREARAGREEGWSAEAQHWTPGGAEAPHPPGERRAPNRGRMGPESEAQCHQLLEAAREAQARRAQTTRQCHQKPTCPLSFLEERKGTRGLVLEAQRLCFRGELEHLFQKSRFW